ncbi:TPA: hypothetical protein ACK3RK_006139 [Burkholderia cepacia]
MHVPTSMRGNGFASFVAPASMADIALGVAVRSIRRKAGERWLSRRTRFAIAVTDRARAESHPGMAARRPVRFDRGSIVSPSNRTKTSIDTTDTAKQVIESAYASHPNTWTRFRP